MNTDALVQRAFSAFLTAHFDALGDFATIDLAKDGHAEKAVALFDKLIHRLISIRNELATDIGAEQIPAPTPQPASSHPSQDSTPS
jgi:hypothetical protein